MLSIIPIFCASQLLDCFHRVRPVHYRVLSRFLDENFDSRSVLLRCTRHTNIGTLLVKLRHYMPALVPVERSHLKLLVDS
jgi:hypothetical protein